MESFAKTPLKIAEERVSFSIPIYQRLFSWTPNEIGILLSDLYAQFTKNRDEHYYIGLLTSTYNNELVDGQQRFTVLMLLAIAMREKYKLWEDFLLVDDQPRLNFTARKDDEAFLNATIHNNDDNRHSNEYMQAGIQRIKDFLGDINDAYDFCKYVFEHTAFFIQKLPEGYSGRMLNKYFESMNSTGRNLENHEILKVELLERAQVEENEELYDRLVNMWNLASRMNQTIFPMYEEKRLEYKQIISEIYNGKYKFNSNIEDNEHSKSIISVINESSDYNPRINKKSNTSMHSFLKFTDFLLLILYMILEDKGIDINNKQDFFKPENLRKTFKNYADYYQPIDFIEDLFIYRIILDWAVIRVDDSYDYRLALSSSETSKLQQFEAMLYANTSRDTYYQWIPVILRFVRNNGDDEEPVLAMLKATDNKIHPFTINDDGVRPMIINDFSFKKFNRYFYRRLDYYLWEYVVHGTYDHTQILSENLSQEENVELETAISSYKFHQYNSEEHLYPRDDDKQDPKNRWFNEHGKKDETSINAFGNLALISGPFNSSQGYDALDRKFGSIRDQIKQKKLESIKLALMYYNAHGKSENWTAGENGTSKKHGELMFEFLKNTYTN